LFESLIVGVVNANVFDIDNVEVEVVVNKEVIR
jgi:hypothetical protein